jgi:hypothetical protein
MNKWYFGIPILALILFGAYFAKFKHDYDAGKAAAEAEAKAQLEQQALAEAIQRKIAIEQNNLITEENNKKKAAEKEEQRRKQEARDAAVEVRTQRTAELTSLRRDYEQVQKDLLVEEQLFEKAKTTVASHEAEKAFLGGYVQLAEKNANRMLALIEKVDKAAAEAKKQLDVIAAAASQKKQ